MIGAVNKESTALEPKFFTNYDFSSLDEVTSEECISCSMGKFKCLYKVLLLENGSHSNQRSELQS